MRWLRHLAELKFHEALRVEFKRWPLSSSHHKVWKVKCLFLYLHFIFIYLFIYFLVLVFFFFREDSTRNPGLYFWPCERCFNNLHPGPISAHECKMFYFYTFRQEILVCSRLFPLQSCINLFKKRNFTFFHQTENWAVYYSWGARWPNG